jgi:hypothetical protein
MKAAGSLHQWYRFVDAHSDDEAVSTLLTHVSRLYHVQEDLRVPLSRLSYSPDAEVSQCLLTAFNAISEAMETLESVAARFRAGERGIA